MSDKLICKDIATPILLAAYREFSFSVIEIFEQSVKLLVEVIIADISV